MVNDKFFESLINYAAGNGSMVEWHIEGIDKKYGPLQYRSVVKRNDDYPITDDIMVIDISGFDRDLDFTAKERKNPIFYPGNSVNEEITTFHIPPEFEVYYMPKDVNLDIGFFSIKRNYVRRENEIKVDEIVRYKRTQLPKEDYFKVKDFFDKLPGKTRQRIILRKKP